MGQKQQTLFHYTKPETNQSIENYVEKLEMEEGVSYSREKKEMYEQVILQLLDEIRNVKVEIFNHEFTVNIKPVQGK
tara:strand:- start:2706 stop:2936 length:231 start_codon:yes stop_codon:yes gene_type:complete